MTRLYLSCFALNKHTTNTFTCFFPSYIRSTVLSVTVFFIWIGKWEFGKCANEMEVEMEVPDATLSTPILYKVFENYYFFLK